MTVVSNLRVRKVDENGDRVFGGDQAAFHRNTPEAVAVVAEARLNLWEGEWYLDRSEGTPYETDVLGFRTEDSRDAVLKARILDTPGVTDIASYDSTLDRQARAFAPAVGVQTQFGAASARAGSGGRTSVRLPVTEDR